MGPNYLYGVAVILFLIGFYAVIARPNLIKKIIGLCIMETAVFFLLIAIGSKQGGSPPIIFSGIVSYVNPLPQTIVLMAMIISVAVTALALAIAIKIFELEQEERG
ncbi:MAG: cation:proton antiporter subunit C [Candidatus Subteraquimicrobiales bacterium]|nr:cation:proton antiporter subunit C [Candidatus Subteraquimicrobiales bacterium]